MPPQDQQQQNQGGGRLSGRTGPDPLMFEMFAGVNTATTRSGVVDQQAYWLDGWMPLSPRNLRTLWGVGTSLYSAVSLGVVCFYFYNLQANPYTIVFQSDGSAVQVNTSTGNVTQVLPAGTITAPGITTLGISQYGQQYLIIVANQSNGYWIWDGTTLYSAGGLAPGVIMTNVGSGYSAPPTVTATGGNGTGATFAPVLNSIGQVVNVNIINPGSGYFATDSPSLVFTGGTGAGTGGTLTATLSHFAGGSGATLTANWAYVSGSDVSNLTYRLVNVTITSGGSAYSNLVAAAFGLGTSNGAWANSISNEPPTLILSETNGVISGIVVRASTDGKNPNNYYVFSFGGGGLPQVLVSDPGYYYVSSVAITAGGSNYSPSIQVTAAGGGTPQTEAVIIPTVSGGVITGVTISNPGVYGSNSPPTLTVSDVSTAAAGTISLSPIGTQGTNVETYQGRVWVFNGALGQFSAPGSVSDFSTAAGGGSFTSSDSFLKVAYTQAVQTNGFLFTIADSSMNYISGVSTSGTPPTTTYTNNNSDPEIGTPYPAAVTTLGQDILLGNSTGIFVSSGGAFVKRSEPLDGVFNTVPNFNGVQLSAAKATIFGKRVWMMLVPIVDPVSSATVNKLMMFNGKYWWASEQDVPLTFIAGQEIGSVYKAWGTDGTNIYPLFQAPSTAFTKTAQSKLWDAPIGYDHIKSAVNLFALAQFLGTENFNYEISIDNEYGVPNSGATYTGSAAAPVSWIDATGAAVTWEDGSAQIVTWVVTGSNVVAVLPPQSVGQIGRLTGMTVTTNSDDLVLISAMLQDEIVGYTA